MSVDQNGTILCEYSCGTVLTSDAYDVHLLTCKNNNISELKFHSGYNNFMKQIPSQEDENIDKLFEQASNNIIDLNKKIISLEMQNMMLVSFIKYHSHDTYDEICRLIENFDIKDYELDGQHQVFIRNDAYIIEPGLYNIILVGAGGSNIGYAGRIKHYLVKFHKHHEIQIEVGVCAYHSNTIISKGGNTKIYILPNIVLEADGGKSLDRNQIIIDGNALYDKAKRSVKKRHPKKKPDNHKLTSRMKTIHDLHQVYPFIEFGDGQNKISKKAGLYVHGYPIRTRPITQDHKFSNTLSKLVGFGAGGSLIQVKTKYGVKTYNGCGTRGCVIICPVKLSK